MLTLLRLFGEFFRAGLFAVGGGLATVPFLSDIGMRTGWFTQSELADMIAVGESTPGPIGVNMATYVGYTTAGIPGAVVATLGLVAPALIITFIIAAVLAKFRSNRYVDGVFYGLRPASTALIASAGWGVVCISLLSVTGSLFAGDLAVSVDLPLVLLAGAVFLFTHIKPTRELHPILWIALSALAGILFRL